MKLLIVLLSSTQEKPGDMTTTLKIQHTQSQEKFKTQWLLIQSLMELLILKELLH